MVIPSFKRWDNLVGSKYFKSAKYVVCESQAKHYEKALGAKRLIVMNDEHDGTITKKRNWILKNVERPLIMIDDDVPHLMVFDKRSKGNYLCEKLDGKILDEVFEHMVDMAREFDVRLFGLAQNMDNRVYKEFLPFSLTSIILGRFQGHMEHDMVFDDRVGTKEDYDMSLQHLLRYKKILRFNKFAHMVPKDDNRGGIVATRTQESEINYCKQIMLKWGRDIIEYRLPPTKLTDLLNAKKVNVPVKGV